jgi:hypothetical protein
MSMMKDYIWVSNKALGPKKVIIFDNTRIRGIYEDISKAVMLEIDHILGGITIEGKCLIMRRVTLKGVSLV